MGIETELQKMKDFGVSWCEGGETSSGDKTTICGKCVYFDAAKCGIVADELELCEE